MNDLHAGQDAPRIFLDDTYRMTIEGDQLSDGTWQWLIWAPMNPKKRTSLSDNPPVTLIGGFIEGETREEARENAVPIALADLARAKELIANNLATEATA